MRKIIAFLGLAFLVAACRPGEPQVVKINNEYSLTLPDFLTENKTLHNDASLKYANLFKEFYVIVIDESKQEFHDVIDETELSEKYNTDLDGYTSLLIDNMGLAMTGTDISSPEETKINGLDARMSHIQGSVDGIPVYYTFVAIEGKEKYFQILTWTLAEKRDEYQEQMQGIVRSFQEL